MTNRPIKTSKRAFEILEAFEDVQRPMALKEFVQRFDYPASSASALLKSLVVLGYLDYDRFSRTYMPTMRLASLGNWVHSALFGEGDVLSLMQALSQTTGETITLGAQSDLFVQYVYLIPSRLPIWYTVPIGMTRPIARSGIGWLMLGVRPDEEIDRILRRVNFRERDASRRIALDSLMVEIEKGRRDGFVFSQHTLEPGAGSIAMLLPERRFGRVFAMGVHGPVERLAEKREAILAQLRTGIQKLEMKSNPV
ncbi:IclR family transcriptional regulator [Allopusillimonas ginsengisoli]|uniref:IclR family transcriptional regulator n=1 Tax=Allopusillimonas ginsengisoli TaxID=453575 RepID=UPI00102257CB|nr:IclR family transcriptional regulator [Allopusillimonas ginsengisoli]TEA77183.1 IclR family transcriptional regulator [Allopusillimonas ginsengisoli]